MQNLFLFYREISTVTVWSTNKTQNWKGHTTKLINSSWLLHWCISDKKETGDEEWHLAESRLNLQNLDLCIHLPYFLVLFFSKHYGHFTNSKIIRRKKKHCKNDLPPQTTLGWRLWGKEKQPDLTHIPSNQQHLVHNRCLINLCPLERDQNT